MEETTDTPRTRERTFAGTASHKDDGIHGCPSIFADAGSGHRILQASAGALGAENRTVLRLSCSLRTISRTMKMVLKKTGIWFMTTQGGTDSCQKGGSWQILQQLWLVALFRPG